MAYRLCPESVESVASHRLCTSVVEGSGCSVDQRKQRQITSGFHACSEGAPADIRAFDRYGVVCTQPAGDKERENFGRQWDQRVELMRDVILYFRNHPSIFFWEAGNNSISKEHMREMRLLKQKLDPMGGQCHGMPYH